MSISTQKIIGIDLGTYNSSAAIKLKNGRVEIVKSLGEKSKSKIPFFSSYEKHKEFPSFISFDKDGMINDVGISSKNKVYDEPEYVVWGIKRLLGKSYSELKNSGELDRFPYRIKPDRNTGQCLVVIGTKSYSPVQLCTEIFRKIKYDAEKIYGKIDSGVISVPAYFDPVRVTPIVEAARNAGFIHVKTIPEPVAAALAFQIDITIKPIKMLVFDLGAGTLDVTVGYIYRHPDQPGEFNLEVIKNTGDPKLGGIDMDDRLLALIEDKCGLSTISSSEKTILRRSAENAKIQLSEEPKIEHVFHLNGEEYSCTINQFELKSAFESNGLEKNLLENCRYQIMSAIEEAGWNSQEIELLIMIGGPTKLPCIHEIFKVVFRSNPAVLKQLDDFYSGKEKVDRMTAVSIGAALSIDQKVNDKVPYGHGIEIIEFEDEYMIYRPEILLNRDSSYPNKSKSYNIPWTNLNGLFEFKIIQHIPKSEIQQFGYEFKFVGIQKFAVKDPNMCMIVVEMEYNERKELEVNIRNSLRKDESIKYTGINQASNIGMNYPLKVKKPPEIDPKEVIKIPPTEETLEKFIKWVQVTNGFVQRKIENFPISHIEISQNSDEIRLLLQRNNPKSYFEKMYNGIYALVNNSNSVGLLTQEEYLELTNRLSEFENELFRFTKN